VTARSGGMPGSAAGWGGASAIGMPPAACLSGAAPAGPWKPAFFLRAADMARSCSPQAGSPAFPGRDCGRLPGGPFRRTAPAALQCRAMRAIRATPGSCCSARLPSGARRPRRYTRRHGRPVLRASASGTRFFPRGGGDHRCLPLRTRCLTAAGSTCGRFAVRAQQETAKRGEGGISREGACGAPAARPGFPLGAGRQGFPPRPGGPSPIPPPPPPGSSPAPSRGLPPASRSAPCLPARPAPGPREGARQRPGPCRALSRPSRRGEAADRRRGGPCLSRFTAAGTSLRGYRPPTGRPVVAPGGEPGGVAVLFSRDVK
jgi:hypothetical protein